jgi:hypothetical protein
MVAVSGFDKLLGFRDQEALFPHDPVHFLVIDRDSFPMQLTGDFPIPGFRELFGDLFDPVDQDLILLEEFLFLVIVAASRELHEFAPPRDGFDKVSVVGNELPFFRD